MTVMSPSCLSLKTHAQLTSQHEQATLLSQPPPLSPGLVTGETSSGIEGAPCTRTQTQAWGWYPGSDPGFAHLLLPA